MNTIFILIWLAGLVHLVIAGANFAMPALLKYRDNLKEADPMVRQVFWVHGAYIVYVLFIFGAGCLFFTEDLAGGSHLGRFLSASLAIFWGVRLWLQLYVYDPEVKRRYPKSNLLFTGTVSFLTLVFSLAAVGGAS